MSYTDVGQKIKEAAKAHTDLSIFSAVMILMEGSLVSSRSAKSAAKIIALCKAEQQACLGRYDRAMEEAGGGHYG